MKSVYRKSQSVIGGKLFFSYRTVFELALSTRVFKIPKQVTWIVPMRHLSRKKHWPYVKKGCLHHFYMRSIIITSFRKAHTYVLWYWIREDHPCMGVKPLLFSLIPNIFAVHIVEDRWRMGRGGGGGIHGLVTFYKLLLRDIKVKVLKNSWHFLMVFLDVPSDLWLTLLFFSQWNVLRWYT